MADRPRPEPDVAPENRAARRRKAKGRPQAPAPEARRAVNPDARGRSPHQQRLRLARR